MPVRAEFVAAIGLALALGLAVAAVGASGRWLERRPRPADSTAVPIYLPQARFLRPLSLGYHNVLSDILWFRTINYFGDHYYSDRTYPWLAYMCDLVTDLDPRADYVYRFAGMVLPWEANEIDQGMRLLEKGAAALPDSWQMHYWLGFSYYFFKSDYERALAHMQRAALLPGAHPTAAQLAALLHQHQYGPETTLHFLGEIARNSDNEQMREVAREHIRETQLARDVELLNGAVTEYHRRVGAYPPSTAALVEARLLTKIPSDPFGGVYVIDEQTGTVRSSTGRQPARLYRSKTGESVLRGEPLPR